MRRVVRSSNDFKDVKTVTPRTLANDQHWTGIVAACKLSATRRASAAMRACCDSREAEASSNSVTSNDAYSSSSTDWKTRASWSAATRQARLACKRPRFAATASGYLLVETDAGLVTINPHAARERIAFEQLLSRSGQGEALSQQLLIPETIHLSPVDAARITAALGDIEPMGFRIEPFGRDTFKIDAVPQIIGSLSPAAVVSTIARDLSEGGARRGERWREDLVAKSVARSFAGMSLALDETGATRLVEELASCRMPYVSPGGKPTMIFTSTNELDRKFAKN